METTAQHLSENQREGSLREVSLEEVLATCRKHRFTGKISIRDGSQEGELELNAGVVDVARFDGSTGTPAVTEMCALHQGHYLLSQRLPDLDGAMGPAAVFEGRVKDRPLVAIMRHCEENALTCVVRVERGDTRGEIHYRLGEIIDVTLDGKQDEDAIVTLVHLEKARYSVAAPPLEPSLHGWPALEPEPTAPFRVTRIAGAMVRSRPLRALLIGLALAAVELGVLAWLAMRSPGTIETITRFFREFR